MLRFVCKDLGIVHLGLSLHSAHQGAPPQDFLEQTADTPFIQRTVAWKSPSSARRYERRGRLVGQLAKLTSAQIALMENAADACEAKLINVVSSV